ncbi:DUF6223 family protein [Actinoplanes sp. URMC 104]|uniref:DUF6223 family protein n=1 Tax=Actinoplanes sp. URMC 104 TaxID=3423409 RepID=UPI003F1969A6
MDAYTFTGGRLLGSAAALIALAGAILGRLALTRPGRRRTTAGLAAGGAGAALGGFVVAVADGGPGSGSGIMGGFVALGLGLLGVGLAWAGRRRHGAVAGRATSQAGPD